MKDHRTKLSKCTSCGEAMDSAMNAQFGINNVPSSGDVTVCMYCSHIMIYDDNLILRDPSNDELIDIAANKDILRAVNAIAKIRGIKP